MVVAIAPVTDGAVFPLRIITFGSVKNMFGLDILITLILRLLGLQITIITVATALRRYMTAMTMSADLLARSIEILGLLGCPGLQIAALSVAAAIDHFIIRHIFGTVMTTSEFIILIMIAAIAGGAFSFRMPHDSLDRFVIYIAITISVLNIFVTVAVTGGVVSFLIFYSALYIFVFCNAETMSALDILLRPINGLLQVLILQLISFNSLPFPVPCFPRP